MKTALAFLLLCLISFILDFMQYSDLGLPPGTNLHHGARHGTADGKALEHGTD